MDDLLKTLNECYRHELMLVTRYLHYSVTIGGMDRLHLAEFFKANAMDSVGHAEKVGAKIVALGAVPHGEVTEELGTLKTAEEILRQALKDEEAAVALYNLAIPLSKKDLALRELLVHILKEEQAGVDELKHILA